MFDANLYSGKTGSQALIIASRSTLAMMEAAAIEAESASPWMMGVCSQSKAMRSASTAQRFLAPSLAHLHAPEKMAGSSAAVDRIDAAIERKESILIYGDYDVDGTMAVIILKTAIELCGGTADFHVPHRIREGYDMRDDVIERAAAAGIHLIISVDMGIRAFGPAGNGANRLGVDLIVTDHHLPGHDGVPMLARD